MLYTTDSEKLALAIQWLERLRDEYGGTYDFSMLPATWTKQQLEQYCEGHGKCLAIDLNVALKEVTGTKWPFEKVSEAMGNLLEKHIIDVERHVNWEKFNPEADRLLQEAGWDHEEIHWETIRHAAKPPFCACWNISPENEGRNPLPYTEN